MPPLSRKLAIVAWVAVMSMTGAAQGAKDKAAPAKLATQGAVPAVGEITLDHTFRNLISGDGRTSMASLRGSVILIDWWGIH